MPSDDLIKYFIVARAYSDFQDLKQKIDDETARPEELRKELKFIIKRISI